VPCQPAGVFCRPDGRFATWPEASLGCWQGIFVPKETPKPIISKWVDVVRKVVHDPSVGARYEKVSAQQTTSDSLDGFASFMQEQHAFWAKIIKVVGIETQ